MKQHIKVIISGGGTGGHIFPAIAIANAVKKRFRDAEILFIGAEGRMEMKKVPDAGYDIIGLQISGLNRRNPFKNIPVIWKLLKSFSKARKILKKFKPDIVIGVGGYASGPTLKMANSLKIPTLIQEQNSYAGVTNKFLSGKASAICVAYEGMERFFPKDKIILTGNPCRQDLANTALTKEEACKFFKLDPDKKTILIIGGSLGSRTINRSVMKGIDAINDSGVQVIWQCGEFYLFDLSIELSHKPDTGNIHLFDFISRMDLAYKAADLVISRAGASSISELSILGKPAILVPSPNVAEDHQTKNALALVEKDAAVMIADKESEQKLIPAALGLINNKEKLNSLSDNILKLAQYNSADRIVDEMVKIINNKKQRWTIYNRYTSLALAELA